MHILFVHQNFPAQFGHIASYLVKKHGIRCTFVSQQPPGHGDGIERIQYHLQGGATQQTHYCSRTAENAVWHSHAVYEALRARPDIKPDLIVGHSGFLTTVFLTELYHCPTVNYFEYYDDVPLAVEGGEQLLMETPYPTFLFSASCPSLESSK